MFDEPSVDDIIRSLNRDPFMACLIGGVARVLLYLAIMTGLTWLCGG